MRGADSAKALQSQARVARAKQSIAQPVSSQQQKRTGAAAASSSGTSGVTKHVAQLGLHSIDSDRQQTVTSLLSRLQLLQNRGTQFAQRIQPVV